MPYSFSDPEQTFSFTDGVSPVPTDVATAQRAVKADYSIGTPLSPGAPAIANTIKQGNEGQYRQDIADHEAVQNDAARTAVLMKLSQAGPLQPEDIQTVQNLSTADLRPDASTIFEQKFAQKYTADTMNVNSDQPQSPLNRFGYFDAPKASDNVDVFTDLTQRIEEDKTRLENVHADWQQTSWSSAVPQYLAQMVPLLSSYRLHNVLTTAPTTSVLPGENLGEQISYVNSLPDAQRRAAITKAIDSIPNQLDKLTFAQAIVSYNSTDRLTSDVLGVLDASTVGGPLLGKGIKIGQAIRGTVPAGKTFAQAAEKGLLSAPKVDTAAAAIQEMKVDAGVSRPQSKVYYIPEAAAKKLEAIVQPEEGKTVGFTTSKGSTYTYEADQSRTIRDRAPHEGDAAGTSTGPQPKSTTTFFVPAEELDKVRVKSGAPDRLVQFQDGDIGISYKQSDGQWSIPFGSNKLTPQPLPKEGLAPVEVWAKKKLVGDNTPVYDQVHFGNKITSVQKAGAEPTFYTDVKNNVTVPHTTTPAEGLTPFEVRPDGSVHAHPTETGELHYINKETAQAQKPVQKFGRPPEFNATFGPDGKPLFYTDKKNGVTASTIPPGPGAIGVSVAKSGRFKFVATGSQRAAVAENDFNTALKDSAKAVTNTTVEPAATLTQMGDIATGAKAQAAVKLQNMVKGNSQGLEDILNTVQSSFNPQNFFGKGKALSREFADRMVNDLMTNNEFLVNLLGKLNVPRGTEQAIAAGLRETEQKFHSQYGGRLADSILDFVHVPPELNPNAANLDTLVMRVGKPNGLAFDSRAEAEQYLHDIYELDGHLAQGAGYVSKDIRQQGSSFYINVEKHVDETTPAFLAQLHTRENATPIGMVNMMLNRLRSSEDLLSSIQRDNRNIATHAPQVLNKALKEGLELTRGALSSRQRKEVLQILEANRDDVNLANPSKRGTYYTSAADFETAFMGKIGHMPTQEQSAHYFNYVRTSDFEWVIRNLAAYRDKGRLGIEQFSWKTLDEKTGSVVPTKFVEGKSLDEIPWGGQDAGIWVQETGGAGRLVYKHDLVNTSGGLTKADVEKLYKEKGYKVFQVFDPPGRPYSESLFHQDGTPVSEQIHFVISNSLEQKPLGWDQLDYRPGGHSIYKYDWYVKQPQLQPGVGGRDTYYGDNSIMNFASKAQAEKYASRLDTARVMLRDSDPRLPAYLAKNIPYSLQDFQQMFYKGHLNLDHPIVSLKAGTSSFDLENIKRAYPTYVDATKSEYNLGSVIDKSFQADRDAVLNTVKEGPGVFQIAPAAQLDPYTALNRGLGQAVRNLWMADYKIGAVQHWIEEFGTVMDPKFKTVSNSPLYFLYHPQWNEKADAATLAAAKASRLAIVNFVGAQSEIATRITHLQNSLVSSIYTKFGQNASEMVADHALPFIQDPATYLRAVGFHTKLGFFNPIQLFVQSQSLAHVLAVAGPKNALPGYAGAFLARRLLHNDSPQVLDAMANIASKSGWKADDFKQMIGALKMSGIPEVAGETAMRDDIMDPKLYSSTVGKWLDKGTFFFSEGERAVRLAAFSTAFREWKLASPLANLDNRAMGTIMNRSNLLSVNMTRASSASWQSGLISIPTQFLAFNARLAEQFLGGRLTVAEKARAFGTYSALYGIPTAAAGALGVWPFYDDIKEAALARGADLSPAYVQGIMEGIPHMMLSAITGKEYNIAQRLGPNGSNLFKEAITGDKSVLQIAGGPSSSIIGDIWNSTDPIRRNIAGVFTGNSEAWPVKSNDLIGALQNVSTLGLAARIQGAVSYGKYISRTGTTVGDMDSVDAAFAVLGLTPTHIADAQLLTKIETGDRAAQKPYEKLILQNYMLAVQAGIDGNKTDFDDYMKRVSSYVQLGDFNIQEQQKLYQRAMKIQPDAEQRIRWDVVRNAPQSQYIDRFNSFVVNQNKKGQ